MTRDPGYVGFSPEAARPHFAGRPAKRTLTRVQTGRLLSTHCGQSPFVCEVLMSRQQLISKSSDLHHVIPGAIVAEVRSSADSESGSSDNVSDGTNAIGSYAMRKRLISFALFGTFTFGVGAPVHAALLIFNGSANATASVGADASCAPLPFRGIISHANSTGSSNLGSFTYSHNACTQGAMGPVVGNFELDFGSSLLSGGFEGFSVARLGTPGLFDQQFTYSVTGGSGLFAGATGSFMNVGTVDVRGGPPSRLAFQFDGAINAPAVPEPATWAMMLFGFGAVGYAVRSRKFGYKSLQAA